MKRALSVLAVSMMPFMLMAIECGCSVPVSGGSHGTYWYEGDGDCCTAAGPTAVFQYYENETDVYPTSTHMVSSSAAVDACC